MLRDFHPGLVKWLTLAILVLLSGASASAAVSVTASVDRQTIMAGETISLGITVDGGNPQSAENFPPVQGLSIQYRGTSQSMTIVNGQTSAKNTLNYNVTAAQPGQYTIPSVKVSVDGRSYPTQPITLTVTKSDLSAQNRYAFLRLNVPKTEIYVGEIVPIEVQLYVIDAENLQAPQLKSDGFVIHKQLDHTRSQAQVGNILYSVLTFRKTISAAKAGSLKLGPVEMDLVLRLRAQPDPNDVFGFFGRFQRRPIKLTSAEVEMNVLPLPSPAAANFTGAIGSFTWNVSASPTNVSSGDPITIRSVITGRGNFDNVKLPDLNWPDFRVYQPTSTTSIADQLGLEGSKTFEQVIVPQSGGVREIPGVSFSYFDPSQKKFLTLKEPATPLQVRAGPASAMVPSDARATEEIPAERRDIVHIKTDLGQLAAVTPPLITNPWFLLLQAIPLAGVIGISAWRKRQDNLARNPRLRRKVEVQNTVYRGLGELRNLAQANQSDEFYALLFRLLQEQLGERLDLPSSAITEAVLDERLPKRGASPELIARLHALFQIANQARYAPVTTETELLGVSSDLENALVELQQLPD